MGKAFVLLVEWGGLHGRHPLLTMLTESREEALRLMGVTNDNLQKQPDYLPEGSFQINNPAFFSKGNIGENISEKMWFSLEETPIRKTTDSTEEEQTIRNLDQNLRNKILEKRICDLTPLDVAALNSSSEQL